MAEPSKRAPIDPIHAEIGQRLGWARELIYPTQAAFARVMGWDRSTIRKIETGQRALSIINLMTAANKLRTGTEYLLTGDLISVEKELRQRLVQLHPELLDIQPARRVAPPRPPEEPGNPGPLVLLADRDSRHYRRRRQDADSGPPTTTPGKAA